MKEWVRVGLALLMTVGRDLLERIAQNLWDETWKRLFAAVAEAEKRWREAGSGHLRKEWVVDTVLAWLDDQAQAHGRKLGLIEKLALRLLLASTVDALVDWINDVSGEDWVRKLDELEDRLASLLQLVDPISAQEPA